MKYDQLKRKKPERKPFTFTSVCLMVYLNSPRKYKERGTAEE